MEEKSSFTKESFRLMRFLMGFLFALALFLVEIGIAEIVLGNDLRCREIAQSGRVVLDPDAACLPEGIHYSLLVLSRGPFTIVGSQVPSAFAWILTGGLYGIVGGFIALFTATRLGVGIYLGIHALALVLMTILAYISRFIA